MMSFLLKGLLIKRGQVFTFDIYVLYVKCEDLTPTHTQENNENDGDSRLRDGKFKECAKCLC